MSTNYPNFNYAGTDPAGDFLQELKIEENKQAMIAFLDNIPGMQNPPFVYCKVHWISEYGEKGRLIQCFGGQCCEQVTWQKGWGGEPGKFAPTKARHRYFIPIVHYEQDAQNPVATKATVKYLNMTWTAYNALVTVLQNTTEGLSFFDRDFMVTARKVNGATDYIYDKKESQAQWKTNPIYKQQVEEQLPTVAERLKNAMPLYVTPEEFAAIKSELDQKVKAAMASHQMQQQHQQQQQQAQPFGALPGQGMPQGIPTAQPAQQAFVQPQPVPQVFAQAPLPEQNPVMQQPVYTQPQANIPVTAPMPGMEGNYMNTPIPGMPVQPQMQPTPVTTTVEQAPQEPVQQEPAQQELPPVSLAFDPTKLLQ